MPRRGSNIYKRKDGRWEGRIPQSETSSAKRKYVSIYGKTYAEVKDKMGKARNEAPKSGTGVYTVEDAVSTWLNERSGYWKPTTCAAYRNIAHKYILPLLGKYKIEEVDETLIETFVQTIRCNEKGHTLSVGYLHSICSIVFKSLSYLKKKKHLAVEIPENPVIQGRRKCLLLPAEQDMAALEKYLLRNVKDDTCLGILIAFYTGIRLGELCALRWEDINLKEGMICIRRNLQRVRQKNDSGSGTQILFQTPKTETSVRIIPIPPVLLPFMRDSLGEPSEYVVKGKKTPWAEPRTLQYRFASILKKCGSEPFHFHMLRHAFATRCIDKGFDVKSLSEILGHSDIQITLNLYVHSSMQRKKQLMGMFNFFLYQDLTSTK